MGQPSPFERHTVTVSAQDEVGQRDARGHCRIPQAGPVQVNRKRPLSCKFLYGLHGPNGYDRPAMHVVRVLHAHQRGDRVVAISRPNGRGHIPGRQGSSIGCHRVQLHSSQPCGIRVLVVENVGLSLADGLAAGASVENDRRLVGLGAGREEQGGFLAQQIGDPALQPVDSRILAEDVIIHFGLGHGPAHARRRPGDRVGSEIDDSVVHRYDSLRPARHRRPSRISLHPSP